MKNIEKILQRFKDKKILVIGDLILDIFLEGEVNRINPEAPVPIVELKKESFNLGGSGNVASNISSLGGKTFLFGFTGKDEKAEILKDLMTKSKMDFFLGENSLTSQKTRVIGRDQQLLRFDKEETSKKFFSEILKQKLLQKAEESDMIIISDYAKGVITSDLLRYLFKFSNKIIVDPKPSNKELYKGVFLITPNEKESFEMTNSKDFKTAGESLRKELGSNVLITRGERGMALFSDSNLEVPTYAKEVYDVTGAGDTVIAALALSLASGASLEEAAIIANHAAGIAVARKGTYSVKFSELYNDLLQGQTETNKNQKNN